MAWFYLILAGVFECGWAVGLKYTDGFTRLVPSVFTVISMIISLWLLGLSIKTIPLGTAYAIWTGIGAVCVAILGMILFKDPVNLARIISLMLIITGIVGLKFYS